MSEIISFDFDNTLARISVQTFALKVKQIGYPICITTSRYEKHPYFDNQDLYTVADKLGIKNIFFTNMNWKFKFIAEKNFFMHFDDDEEEISKIEAFTKCHAIHVIRYNWMNNAMKILLNN